MDMTVNGNLDLTVRTQWGSHASHQLEQVVNPVLECQFLGTVWLPWLDSRRVSAGVLRCHNDSTSPSTASAHTAILSLFSSQPLASTSASSGLPLVSLF